MLDTQDKSLTYFSYAELNTATVLIEQNSRFSAEIQVLMDFLQSGCYEVTDPYGYTEGIDEGMAAFRLAEIIGYHEVIID